MGKFDAISVDMFDSTRNGNLEKKTEKDIKNKQRAKKAAETKIKNKHKKKMDDLHKFEKEHPESFLFEEQREFYSLLKRMK